MKILIITPTYAPAWKFGGTVAAMTQLAQALNSHPTTSVTVYTTNASNEEEKLAVNLETSTKVDGVPTFYFDCGKWNSSAFYSVDMIKDLKNNVHKYDIVYISAIWQLLGYTSAKICSKHKIPYVLGIHGSFSKRLRQRSKLKKEIYYQFLLKTILKKAAAIHVTGDQEIKDAGGWIDNYTTIKIPNIINNSKYTILEEPLIKQNFRAIHNIPKNSKIILTVCRPDWMKRVDILLEAISSNENYYLIYVGDIKNTIVKEWKDKAKKLELTNRFICTGELKGVNLIAAYNNADIFSLISMNENFSMVVVEALLCGAPVLISEEVGVGEYLNENPYTIITKLDKDIISKKLDNFFDRNTTIDKNKVRNSILNVFSSKHLSNLFINNFQEILNTKSNKI